MLRLPPVFLATALSFSVLAAPVLRNPLPVATGTNSLTELLGADFNGDSYSDVLIVSSGNALSLLINNGTGPFAAPVVTPIPYATGWPGIGDVNCDGRGDVVVSDFLDQRAIVMAGNASGTFAAASTLTLTGRPGPIALADFNGDMFLDVAVGLQNAAGSSHWIEVRFGSGTGSFSGSVSTSVPQELRVLTSADMNGDGKADLIAGGWSSNRILIGDGTGAFLSKGSKGDGGVAIGDFNGDGKRDLAIAAPGSRNYIEVALGIGDGSVGDSTLYVAGYESDSIASADVDGDGKLDLLAAGIYGCEVTVLRGKGDGTFHAPQFFLSGPNAWRLLVADFDRDGKRDVLTVDSNTTVTALSFVKGNGDGTFQTYRAFHTGSIVPVSYPFLRSSGGVVADMNHDGRNDAIVIQRLPGFATWDLAVMLNDGTGKLAPPRSTDTDAEEWGGAPSYAIGDVNNDGKRDAVVVWNSAAGAAAKALLGNGDGTFVAGAITASTLFGKPELGHFDANANLDLLVRGDGQVAVYPGNGDGTFGAAVTTNVSATNAVIADVNGDAKLDLVFANSVYLNNGTAGFAFQQMATLPVSGMPFAAATGDFNGDGKTDILSSTPAEIQTRFGNGDGTFGAIVRSAITSDAGYVLGGSSAAADFNDDGKLDVAFGPTMYLGNGDGSFRSRAQFRMNNFTSIAAARMDANSSADLVIFNGLADGVDVLLTGTSAEPAASSSIALTADKPSGQYGETVKFTATVTGGTAPKTGVVTFEVAGRNAVLLPVDASGKAALTTAFAIGAHPIKATYSGDENVKDSTASLTWNVGKANPQLNFNSYPNPAETGTLVTFQPWFSFRPAAGFQAPTGEVTVREGATILGTDNVYISSLSLGTHQITMEYPGDANYTASTASGTHVITKPMPQLVFQTSPSYGVIAGQTVTLQASFVNQTNITGTIVFELNGAAIGTVTLNSGVASLQTTFPWGFHTLRARYSGDATWEPVESTIGLSVAINWGTPLGIRATSYPNSAFVRWSEVVGATSYTLWIKRSLGGAWESYLTGSINTTNVPMPSATMWLFAVSAKNANGDVSPMSIPDLATTVSFTDPSMTSGSTPIRALHFTELRTAIGIVRTFAGLGAYSWSRANLAGQFVSAVDVRELREALAQARSAIGLPVIAFTDPTLTPGSSVVRAAHIRELRDGAS